MSRSNAYWLALGTALISGFSNYLAKIAVTVVSDPVVFTLLKNAVVAVLLVGIIAFVSRFREWRRLSRQQWVRLITIGVVGGSIPFILFFVGLTKTTALSGGLIHKTLFIWVALLAVPFLKERITALQGAAFILLILGNFMLGGVKGFSWGTGELMILAATLFWAVENIIAKKVLADLSSITVAGARMAFGSVILAVVVLFQGNFDMIFTLTGTQWLWTLIPAALLLGYVTTWYTALKYARASIVASLLVPATFITNILTQVLQDKTMTPAQISSGVAICLGIGLLLWELFRQRSQSYQYAADAHRTN
ncbi:MAG: DMT family transporter [Candidatus Kerfeldbacteria bacterium]|nr:DMT family transporter [Candidatus Kerfeldbacteria bacterium]